MPHRQFAEEFKWLEELAREVDAFGGFYKQDETAAIYCPNCETIQSYCTGCGQKLIDVFDEATATCQNCGISLAHCAICGHLVETMEAAPEHLQEPEYWKYCPACGRAVFATTDMCPHCKVSMGNHLDRIYEQTYKRVNQAVIEEETIITIGRKAKPDRNRQTPFLAELANIKLCPDCRHAMVAQVEICERCGTPQTSINTQEKYSKSSPKPSRFQQFILWLYRKYGS